MKAFLSRVSFPVLMLSVVILSVGLVVKEAMPDPKVVSFSPFVYEEEIPGHTRVSDLTARAEAVEAEDVPAFPGSFDIVRVTLDYTVERKNRNAMTVYLADDQDRVFEGKTEECGEQILTRPFHCRTVVELPADALGDMTFLMDVETLFGEGFHQQTLPMPKRIEIPVEVQ